MKAQKTRDTETQKTRRERGKMVEIKMTRQGQGKFFSDNTNYMRIREGKDNAGQMERQIERQMERPKTK